MSKADFDAVLKQLTELAERLSPLVPSQTSSERRKARLALEVVSKRLASVAEEIDYVMRPSTIFDPGDPITAGRVVALTLVAQPKRPLAALPDVYGSGVYALYYKGPFSAYAPISGQEHPIYVGKADPDHQAAKDAVSQGIKVTARLREHGRNISKAHSTLNLNDFECRFLIVQTGFQKTAEDYLIHQFKPIWNSETGICFGLGKHGDSAGTRANKRSPWDTLHPGRKWAQGTLADQKPESQILQEISTHFAAFPPFATLESVLSSFLADMRQLEIKPQL